MIKHSVLHILKASAIASVAIAFSGVAMAADTSGITIHALSSEQAAAQNSTGLVSADGQNVVVQVSTSSSQSTDNQQSTSTSPKGIGNQHNGSVVTVSKESVVTSSTGASSNPEQQTMATDAGDVTKPVAVTKLTTPASKSDLSATEQVIGSSMSPVNQHFVSQSQVVTIASQSSLASNQTPVNSAVQAQSPISNQSPTPASDIPSLPGSIAQRLSSTVSTYSTSLHLLPVNSSSSSLPAILSSLLAVGMLGLIMVGSLYLMHLHASGFLSAGRAVPSFTFVTDHLMSFTGAANVLESSFFNRQYTQKFNLMHT